MMGYWLRFAATGNPNGDGPPVWPVYDLVTDPYLVLGTDVHADAALHTGRAARGVSADGRTVGPGPALVRAVRRLRDQPGAGQLRRILQVARRVGDRPRPEPLPGHPAARRAGAPGQRPAGRAHRGALGG